MKFKWVFISLFFLCCNFAIAQIGSSIYGKVVNDSNKAPLSGVGVTLFTHDSETQYATTTGNNGVFAFNNIPPGKYRIQASFIGFQPVVTDITVSTTTVNAGVLKLRWMSTTMQTAVIVGKVIPVEQKGDTTEFNAEAYKTHPD